MLRKEEAECQVENGHIFCDTDQEQPVKVGESVPKDRAASVEQEFQNRQRAINEERGTIRNWMNEPKLDECYSKYKRADGEVEHEFICIEKHRHEQLKEGVKEISKAVAPSF
jgi:hypothetical protein